MSNLENSSNKFNESKIVKKPICLGDNKPIYWFGDELTVGFQGDASLCTKAAITGIRFCYDKNEWMYCFELGIYSWSGQIWFTEWEVVNFQSEYVVEPPKSTYPNQDTDNTEDEAWDEIPF